MNKLMIRHTMDKPLPYDAEVEWLESTGTQYIALGLTMLGTDIVTVRCKNTDTTVEFNAIFGREKASDNKYWANFYANDGRLYYYNTYLTAVWTALIRDNQYYYNFDTNWNTFVFNGIYCDVNGVRYQQNKPNHRTDSPDLDNPYLFACNHATTLFYGYVRISSFKIERNGVTIMDLMPVRKGNTGYMYDKVSGRLFGNQGTGSFVVGPDYNPFAYQYLTFVPLEDSTFSFSKRGTGNDIEYSIDGGVWTSLASEANTPTVCAGHNIRWRAELVPSTSSNRGIGVFSSQKLYDAMGNTMSLLYGDNYIGQTTMLAYGFYALFLQSKLYRCNNLLLPAISLSGKNYCYASMFNGCKSLIKSPKLPATVLAPNCYRSMFLNCSMLVEAPELTVSNVVETAYYQMFKACAKLSYIKMLAANIANENSLHDWVSGVASTGTFTKNAAMTTLPTGVSGIPDGWTVVDDPSTINS